MDADRWRVVSDLFLAALERELPDRMRFVRAAAGVDDELARDVEVLLASNEMAGAFMEVSPVRAANAPARVSSHAEAIAPEDGGGIAASATTSNSARSPVAVWASSSGPARSRSIALSR